MAHYEHSTIIPAKRAEVFDHYSHIENLLNALPHSIKAETTGPVPKFEKGVEFEVRGTRYGVSLLWSGIIEDFEKDHYYIDRQIDGPFSLWIHTHKFEDHASGTLVTDLIEYDLPFGLFGKLLDDLYVRRELKKFFDFRHAQVKKFFESEEK